MRKALSDARKATPEAEPKRRSRKLEVVNPAKSKKHSKKPAIAVVDLSEGDDCKPLHSKLDHFQLRIAQQARREVYRLSRVPKVKGHRSHLGQSNLPSLRVS